MARLCAGALLSVSIQIIRKFIQCNAVVAGVHFLQIFLGVEQFVGQEVGVVAAAVIPRAEIQPASLFGYQVVQCRDAVIFSHSDHLLAVILLHDGIEGAADRTVVVLQYSAAGRPVCAVVLVVCYNVYIFIARIPVCRGIICVAVPFPDQIVQTVFLGQCLIGEDPQFLINGRAFLAPPEPGTGLTAAAFCLMERTEDQRNICILQFLQLSSQSLQAKHIIFPFLGAFYQNLGRFEVSLLRNICCICPVYLITDIVAGEVLWYSDMPGCSCNTLVLGVRIVIDPLDDTICGAVLAAVQRVAVQIVEAADCRVFAGGVVDVVELIFKVMRTILIDLLLSGDDVLAVNAGQILHQAVCLCGCCRVAALGVAGGDVRECCLFYCDVVEVGPAPAAHDGNLVVAGIQFYRTQIQFLPLAFLGGGETALTLVYVVDVQILDLVAVRCGIGYLNGIHSCLFCGNGNRNLVAAVFQKYILSAGCVCIIVLDGIFRRLLAILKFIFGGCCTCLHHTRQCHAVYGHNACYNSSQCPLEILLHSLILHSFACRTMQPESPQTMIQKFK